MICWFAIITAAKTLKFNAAETLVFSGEDAFPDDVSIMQYVGPVLITLGINRSRTHSERLIKLESPLSGELSPVCHHLLTWRRQPIWAIG